MILSSDVEHAVMDGSAFLCRRCGKREEVGFPVKVGKRLEAMVLTGQAFAEEHAACEETDKSPSKLAARSPEDWLKSGDTGTSSRFICWHMAGVGAKPNDTYAYPHDPDDFGRCHRLLNLFPHWRTRLSGLALLYPRTPWGPMVREWARMTALYEEELPSGMATKLYALMKQLIAEGERP